jgi:hypothetical protein
MSARPPGLLGTANDNAPTWWRQTLPAAGVCSALGEVIGGGGRAKEDKRREGEETGISAFLVENGNIFATFISFFKERE